MLKNVSRTTFAFFPQILAKKKKVITFLPRVRLFFLALLGLDT